MSLSLLPLVFRSNSQSLHQDGFAGRVPKQLEFWFTFWVLENGLIEKLDIREFESPSPSSQS